MPREINRVLEEAMTVRQVREALEDFDGDARVVFISDYGDYHHTMQALPASEVVDAQTSDLVESAYSQSGAAYVDPNDVEEFEDPEEEVFPLVVIKYF